MIELRAETKRFYESNRPPFKGCYNGVRNVDMLVDKYKEEGCTVILSSEYTEEGIELFIMEVK